MTTIQTLKPFWGFWTRALSVNNTTAHLFVGFDGQSRKYILACNKRTSADYMPIDVGEIERAKGAGVCQKCWRAWQAKKTEAVNSSAC